MFSACIQCSLDVESGMVLDSSQVTPINLTLGWFDRIMWKQLLSVVFLIIIFWCWIRTKNAQNQLNPNVLSTKVYNSIIIFVFIFWLLICFSLRGDKIVVLLTQTASSDINPRRPLHQAWVALKHCGSVCFRYFAIFVLALHAFHKGYKEVDHPKTPWPLYRNN